MKKWVIKAKSADFDGIAKKHNISPILARLIRNRDIISDRDYDYYLNAVVSDMYDPYLLKGMDKACDMIVSAIQNNKHIRVVGDYDIDGVCATAILCRGLKATGARVSHRLPHRIKDGYGLNNTIIEESATDDVDLIITCDNGIAAVNEIRKAKELGMEVIVTDHHEIPYIETDGECVYVLPESDCIVNPHQPDDVYPFKNICGAMVAYKVIIALQKSLHNITKELTDMLFDLAAFATVGDVMPLLDENRIAVKYGLRSMKATKNVGLSALIDETGVKRNKLSAYHIGFVLGPCINAVGRLYSADKAFELLMTDDINEAMRLAKELRAANEERKLIEDLKLKEAFELVENGLDGHDYENDTVLLIYIPDCHESLAGLIAGKIKEKYCKPTIVFTDCETGIKGSGRSIDNYDIFAELSKHRELYQKFGGHPMACGLSMEKANFEELRRVLNAESVLKPEDLVEKYSIDIDMPINYVSMALISELEKMAPFGQANPAPLFAQKNLWIVSRKRNQKGNQVTLQVKSLPHGDKQECIMYATMFGDADEILGRLEGRDTITMAYVPEYNDYLERVQLQIKDFI